MKRRVAPAESSEAPPPELLRFRPSQPAPIGPHGRPEPWRLEWTAGEFSAWLRARAAWRDTHAESLPGLLARERHAMGNLDLPQALVDAEKAGPHKAPEWVERAEIMRASTGRGTGRIPQVAPSVGPPGDSHHSSSGDAAVRH